MKKIISLFLLCSLIFPFSANSFDVVKLSEDPWPPFTYGEDIPTGGIAVEFTHEIFTRLGVDYEIRLYPWERCLHQMRKGKRDGVILSGINEERKLYMVFTDLIMEDRDLIWYSSKRKEPIVWHELEDLKNYVIAATIGFSYGKEFEEAKKKFSFNMDLAVDDITNFKKVAAGRNDIFICNETVALTLFKENPDLKGQFKYAEKPLKLVTLHMAFSKKSPAVSLVPKINTIIKSMQKDGTIIKIIAGN
jgi:polar amino acid transport system substrate-binding protein